MAAVLWLVCNSQFRMTSLMKDGASFRFAIGFTALNLLKSSRTVTKYLAPPALSVDIGPAISVWRSCNGYVEMCPDVGKGCRTALPEAQAQQSVVGEILAVGGSPNARLLAAIFSSERSNVLRVSSLPSSVLHVRSP
jgi:hypothetical protein